MFTDRIPHYISAMYRAVTLMEFADVIGSGPEHQYQEDFFVEMALRTVNKHFMDEGFKLFPLSPYQLLGNDYETPNTSY